MPAALAIIKVPGHSKLNSLEAKGNHLTDISAMHTAPKGTNNQIFIMVQRDVSRNDDLEKFTTEAKQLAQEKEKQNWKSNTN